MLVGLCIVRACCGKPIGRQNKTLHWSMYQQIDQLGDAFERFSPIFFRSDSCV